MRLNLSTMRRPAAAALLGTAIAFGTWACASGGGRSRPAASSTPVSNSPLEGQWRLVSFEVADGSTRKVTGFLTVDRFSTMTVHAELAPDEPVARPPRTVVADFTAKASADAGKLDFTGLSMGVGNDRLTDDAVPMDEWSNYDVNGDTLRLFARDRAGRPAATLVFQRTP